MCGIVGAVAQRDVAEILINGLHRLEYRGYDSAGVAIVDMLLGRLELFTILVMLHPQFWEGYFIKKEVPKRYRIL